MPYLTPHGRDQLRLYKYSGVDHSLVYKYVGSPLADFCVRAFVPRTTAPNTITVVGFAMQVVALVVLLVTSPTMTEPAPRWMAAMGGLALLIYSTMDNMDGKQARRTGSSSPLGLLLDHGCDALNAGITGPLIMHAAYGIPPGSWHFMGIFLLPTIPFFFNTYEEFHIGRFVLPVFNGPNEGLVVLISCYFLTAIYGQAMWGLPVTFAPAVALATATSPMLYSIRTLVGVPDVYGVTTNQDTLFAITAVFVAITVAANTRVALLAELAKGGSAWDAAAVLGRQVPLWLIAAVGCAWNAIPALLAIVAVHPYLFIATLGAQFAAITSQLMVAHAAGQAYEPNVLPLAPLAVPLAAVLASRMGWFGVSAVLSSVSAETCLLAAFVATWTALTHFMLGATAEICDVLDIDVFSIEKQTRRAAASSAAT